MPENTAQPEMPAGGATSTALDLTSERDRGLVRQAMKHWPKRWRGLSQEMKDGFTSSLSEANEAARKLLAGSDGETALKAAAAVASIVRTAAMMEGQNQADEHVADKNARLDEGKATERVEGVVIRVPGVNTQ